MLTVCSPTEHGKGAGGGGRETGGGGRGTAGWKCHCVRLHLLSSDSGVGEGATYPGNKYDTVVQRKSGGPSSPSLWHPSNLGR